jgi:hypothetical protein
VPGGTQSVSIVHSGAAAVKVAEVVTLTGSKDIEVVQPPARLAQDQADPRIGLDSGNQAALRYSVIYSGHDSVANLAMLPGMTAVNDHDFGSSVFRVDRQTSASTDSAIIGYEATSEDVGMMAVAFAEIGVGGGGTGPVPFVAKTVTTPDTESGPGLVDVSGASISAAELDGAGIEIGDPVYVQAIAHLGNTGGTNRSVMALVHGATTFQNLLAEPIVPETYATTNNIKDTPFLHYLWKRAPGEGIKLQFGRVEGGTAHIDQVFLLALGLAGSRRNVDWFWSEVGEEVGLVQGDENNGPFTDGASITIVPAAPIDRFAVFTLAYVEHAASFDSKSRTQLTRSGEASDDEPHQGHFAGAATQKGAMGLMRVYSLSGDVRNNFVLQDNQHLTSGSSRKLSSIFGIDLGRFKTASGAYTPGEIFLSSANYATRLQTITIAPGIQSPVWISGYWAFNPSGVLRNAEFRVQVDNADFPPSQTTDNYQFNGESSHGGSQGYFSAGVANLTQAPHVIDLDASVNSTVDNSGGEIPSLFAVEMWYAAAEAQVPSLGRFGLAMLVFGLALLARSSLRRM